MRTKQLTYRFNRHITPFTSHQPYINYTKHISVGVVPCCIHRPTAAQGDRRCVLHRVPEVGCPGFGRQKKSIQEPYPPAAVILHPKAFGPLEGFNDALMSYVRPRSATLGSALFASVRPFFVRL